jgi:hypothetical protein
MNAQDCTITRLNVIELDFTNTINCPKLDTIFSGDFLPYLNMIMMPNFSGVSVLNGV